MVAQEDIVVTGMRAAGPPPPPPPAPMAERGGYEAVEERLGDVRLYRVPITVTVAGRSQKQVALLRQPSVKVESILRLRVHPGDFESLPLDRLLITRNRASEGLGLPLPAGKVALFGHAGDRRILLGEGSIDDFTIGEKVEIKVGSAPGVLAGQRTIPNEDGGGYELALTNDSSRPQTVEIELPLEAKGRGLVKRDGWILWRVTLPANGTRELRYRL